MPTGVERDAYKNAYDAYKNAYDVLVAAQSARDRDPAAVAAAAEQMRAATGPVADEVQAAWDANVAAVAHAKAAVREALRAQAAVEHDAAATARARNPVRPVLSADELDACHAAARATQTARQWVADAQEAFKAGVRPEQIDGVQP